MRRCVIAVLVGLGVAALPAVAQAGPLFLGGIDAQDGGPGGHGPIANWIQVANSVKGQVTNHGSGLLVIGGGKDPSDDVTQFFNQIGSGTGPTSPPAASRASARSRSSTASRRPPAEVSRTPRTAP